MLLLWGHLLASDTLAGDEGSQSLPENGTPIIATLSDCSMAFDKCLFDLLFGKMLGRIPAIVLRVLIFVYEEQIAWVKWVNARSRQFTISTGTRQGWDPETPLLVLLLQLDVGAAEGHRHWLPPGHEVGWCHHVSGLPAGPYPQRHGRHVEGV